MHSWLLWRFCGTSDGKYNVLNGMQLRRCEWLKTKRAQQNAAPLGCVGWVTLQH